MPRLPLPASGPARVRRLPNHARPRPPRPGRKPRRPAAARVSRAANPVCGRRAGLRGRRVRGGAPANQGAGCVGGGAPANRGCGGAGGLARALGSRCPGGAMRAAGGDAAGGRGCSRRGEAAGWEIGSAVGMQLRQAGPCPPNRVRNSTRPQKSQSTGRPVRNPTARAAGTAANPSHRQAPELSAAMGYIPGPAYAWLPEQLNTRLRRPRCARRIPQAVLEYWYVHTERPLIRMVLKLSTAKHTAGINNQFSLLPSSMRFNIWMSMPSHE